MITGSGREGQGGVDGYNLGKSFQESHVQPHSDPPLTPLLRGQVWAAAFLPSKERALPWLCVTVQGEVSPSNFSTEVSSQHFPVPLLAHLLAFCGEGWPWCCAAEGQPIPNSSLFLTHQLHCDNCSQKAQRPTGRGTPCDTSRKQNPLKQKPCPSSLEPYQALNIASVKSILIK